MKWELERGFNQRKTKGALNKRIKDEDFSDHALSTVNVRSSFFDIEGREGVPKWFLYGKRVKRDTKS